MGRHAGTVVVCLTVMVLIEQAGAAAGPALTAHNRHARGGAEQHRLWQEQGNDGSWTNELAKGSTIIVSMVTVFAAVVAGVGLLCCNKQVPMEAQLGQPTTVGKRKPFKYVSMEAEKKGMARLNSKSGLDEAANAGIMVAFDAPAIFAGGDAEDDGDGKEEGQGYVTIAGEWPADGSRSSPSPVTSPAAKSNRPISANQAFSPFAEAASKMVVFPFDAPGFSALGSMPQGMQSARENPLFDADAMGAIFSGADEGNARFDGAVSPSGFGDEESDRGSDGAESESDFTGFDLSETQPPKPTIHTEEEIFGGFGEESDDEEVDIDAFTGHVEHIDHALLNVRRTSESTRSIIRVGL